MGKASRLKRERREAAAALGGRAEHDYAVAQLRKNRLPPWTPFVRADDRDPGQLRERIEALRKAFGYTEEQAQQAIDEALGAETFVNSRYQVNIRRFPSPFEDIPEMVHLSIKRRDKEPVQEERFRDFQRIKNELVGPNCEGVELYPAENRLVDTSNQYHIWVTNDPLFRWPFGMGERLVVDAGQSPIPNTKQKPFEKD